MSNLTATTKYHNTVQALMKGGPVFWTNPHRNTDGLPGSMWANQQIGAADIAAATARFARFQPVLATLFPELQRSDGVIESALIPVPALEHALGLSSDDGRLFLKTDHELPVAGSIKARGGIHEVLEYAEKIAIRHGLGTIDDLTGIDSDQARQVFGEYQIAVGSTGNLGLSIGVMASALGMKATVHMSADAKEWKKERLRRRNVTVVEHQGDYAAAVEAGRKEASAHPNCHFVDDENSRSLYLGYSAAARTLTEQLAAQQILVDQEHPLFVYIPCGVGGAPGGIAFGLAHVFGANVHCFFAEPTAAPCFLLSMLEETNANPSVYEIGLSNATEADGLAVPQASINAVSTMRTALAGAFTVEDEQLLRHVYTAKVSESIRIEPSAAAGFDGPGWLTQSESGRAYLAERGLTSHMKNSTHIVWTTGGLFVPPEEYARFFERGAQLVAAAS